MSEPSNHEPEMPPTEVAMHRAQVAVAACGGVLVIGAGAWGGLAPAGSAAVGVGLAVLNLFALTRVVMALLGSGTGKAGWAVLGVLKQGALLGGAWLMFRAGFVEPLPFVVGYCALPLGIPLTTIFVGGAEGASETASPSSPGAGASSPGE